MLGNECETHVAPIMKESKFVLYTKYFIVVVAHGDLAKFAVGQKFGPSRLVSGFPCPQTFQHLSTLNECIYLPFEDNCVSMPVWYLQ